MKKQLLALAFAAACAAPVHAQVSTVAPVAGVATPESTVAARELIDAMNFRRMLVGMTSEMSRSMPEFTKMMASQALDKQPGMTAEKKAAALAKMREDVPRLLAAMNAVFSDQALVDQMIDVSVNIYARQFTAEELRQIAAFYKTPVGVKMLTQMPALTQESMRESQRVILPLITKISDRWIAEFNKQ
jgi:hypothetical protein